MVRGLSGWPAWASRSPSCLTVWSSPPARRAVRTHWPGLGQGGRGRIQVLVVVVGQDLDGVGQGRAEVGRVVGADAAADAEAGVGDLPADQLDPQQDGAGPVGVAAPVLDRRPSR